MTKRNSSRPGGSPPFRRGVTVRLNWKRITWAAGIVTALTGAVIGIAKSWEYIEPELPALRGYVRDHFTSSMSKFTVAQQSQTSILRDLQIESAEGKKSQANNSLANWRLEKTKTQDPVTQSLIDRQIQSQQEEINRLEGQLRTLNDLKSRGQ